MDRQTKDLILDLMETIENMLDCNLCGSCSSEGCFILDQADDFLNDYGD